MDLSFTFTPDYTASQSSKPKVRSVQFGDGYVQRITYGLNPDMKKWSLSFLYRSNSDTASITGFFESLAGSKAFYWTSPFGDTRSYICQEWDVEAVAYNLNTITATFQQVPSL